MPEVSERARPNLLLCALLMPLETGGGFPVEEELDAEEEEALALITAACLEKKKWDLDLAPSVFPSDGPAGCGRTHPDLDRDLPSGLQSWSRGCRCLRQKFRWHWSQVTRIISFCLQPPLEHLLVKIWKANRLLLFVSDWGPRRTHQGYLDLSLSLSGVRSAVSVDVFAHFNVGHLASLHWDGDVAQRTHRDLDILQENRNINTCFRCYFMLTGVNHLVLLPLPFCRMTCICDLHMLYDPCRRSPDRRHISLEENLQGIFWNNRLKGIKWDVRTVFCHN